MTYRGPDYQHDQDRFHHSLDDDTYDHAERTLDQHGIGYICSHPDVLLGHGPTYDSFGYADLYLPAAYRAGRPADPLEVLVRVWEGHRLLAELYEPPPLPDRGPGRYPNSFSDHDGAP